MVLDMVYPGRCAICDRVLRPSEPSVCRSCAVQLEYIREPKCRKCGKPLAAEEEYCQDCQGKRTSFRYGHSLFAYDSLLQASMARFKYGGRKEYARYYAQELYRIYGRWIRQVSPDALIPVPIHRTRYRQRGYNQAGLVAEELGRLSGIPVCTNVLVRHKKTHPQKELTVQERKKNIEGAFLVRKGRSNAFRELNRDMECVIIIDDIYTTGSTIEACSRVLKEEGVRAVYFLCICVGKGF